MSEDKKPFGSTKNISELKAPFYYVYMPQYIGDKPILVKVNKFEDGSFDTSECLPTKGPFDLWGPAWVKELFLSSPGRTKERVFFQNYFLAWAYYQKLLTRVMSNQ